VPQRVFLQEQSADNAQCGDKVNILLVEPTKAPMTIGGEDVFLFEPLALEYLAAGVSKEHQVRILDLRLEKNLQGVLTDFKPNVVGITAYTVHVNTVKGLSGQIKRWNPGTLTVVGGHHATVAPEDFLSPSIDLVVAGEGVWAFKEIVSRFEEGDSYVGIPGVVFANRLNLVEKDSQPVGELDHLPFPNRELTAQYRKHYYSEWMKPLASIRTSKGCPFRCNFCAQWKVAGGRYFKRDPQKVVQELKEIEEEFVFFADDESLIDVSRMTALARLIKESGINKRYFLYGRSDTIARYPELLKAWREVGLERVFVGLEFFRDEDLLYIQKGSTLKDNRDAVEILHDLGIDVYASFIIRQQFTKEDFDVLRQYCRQLRLSFASFAVLTPLPGTDLYHEMKDQLITHNYDYFDFLHTLLPTTLTLKEFYAEFLRLYTKGVALQRQFALLRKFPLREIPATMLRARRLYRRLAKAYLDYES
jgi:radical SAM superfamily enzyme YgiQ (UPF0313 family)